MPINRLTHNIVEFEEKKFGEFLSYTLIGCGGQAVKVVNNVQTQLKAEDPGLNPARGYNIHRSEIQAPNQSLP